MPSKIAYNPSFSSKLRFTKIKFVNDPIEYYKVVDIAPSIDVPNELNNEILKIAKSVIGKDPDYQENGFLQKTVFVEQLKDFANWIEKYAKQKLTWEPGSKKLLEINNQNDITCRSILAIGEEGQEITFFANA